MLFPVGYHSRYHHPDPDVAQRYVDRGIAVRATPAAGALEFRLRATGLETAAYREWHRRYWYAE